MPLYCVRVQSTVGVKQSLNNVQIGLFWGFNTDLITTPSSPASRFQYLKPVDDSLCEKGGNHHAVDLFKLIKINKKVRFSSTFQLRFTVSDLIHARAKPMRARLMDEGR